MGLFSGKVVIVTGAGNGIGRAEALAFAKAGASVVVNDVGGARDGTGSGRAADDVVAEIKAAGGDAIATFGSVSDLDAAEGTIWAAINRYKRVDVLVNNAGILRDKGLLNMSEAEWDAVVDVHLKGSFLMTRAFGRAIKMQGPSPSGRYAIVNTTSMSGLLGNFGQANYSSAKAGLFGLTRTASIEFEKLGCRVNAIAPVALTRMTEDIPMLKDMGVDAMGPDHVAAVVTWLASDVAADVNVNGRVFGVHGKKVFEYAMAQSEGAFTDADAWTPEALQAALPSFAMKA